MAFSSSSSGIATSTHVSSSKLSAMSCSVGVSPFAECPIIALCTTSSICSLYDTIFQSFATSAVVSTRLWFPH